MNSSLSVILSVIIVSLNESEHPQSPPHATALCPAPAAVIPFGPKYPWKTEIVATVFWVGEGPTQNNPVPNTKSSWDTAWFSSFGGYDDPDPGNRVPGFLPAGFRPRQNPFYVALPYNDVLNSRKTKHAAAGIIPWFQEAFRKEGRSVCHNRWLAIHYLGRVCFAQWSDCGPFTTDDANYVFGNSRPSNRKNAGAGIDISPAVRDYLQMGSGSKCDWRFVDLHEVGEGPWKDHGTNNPFAPEPVATPEPVFTATFTVSTTRPLGRSAARGVATSRPKTGAKSRLEELRRARDQWGAQKK